MGRLGTSCEWQQGCKCSNSVIIHILIFTGTSREVGNTNALHGVYDYISFPPLYIYAMLTGLLQSFIII